jgi:anti-sigma B factor antagonist
MDIKSTDKGGILLVEVAGEINITSSPEMKRWFEKTQASRIVINLSRVGYIDSSGLATLVELLKKLRGRKGTLALTGMTGKVRSLFEITKLDKLFDIQPTDEAALKGLQ